MKKNEMIIGLFICMITVFSGVIIKKNFDNSRLKKEIILLKKEKINKLKVWRNDDGLLYIVYDYPLNKRFTNVNEAFAYINLLKQKNKRNK